MSQPPAPHRSLPQSISPYGKLRREQLLQKCDNKGFLLGKSNKEKRKMNVQEFRDLLDAEFMRNKRQKGVKSDITDYWMPTLPTTTATPSTPNSTAPSSTTSPVDSSAGRATTISDTQSVAPGSGTESPSADAEPSEVSGRKDPIRYSTSFSESLVDYVEESESIEHGDRSENELGVEDDGDDTDSELDEEEAEVEPGVATQQDRGVVGGYPVGLTVIDLVRSLWQS
ncbi:hypothetical protein LTS10_004336 [Elasticomyces elasticus]|nr:hypothetical protein LTS10_004336 [Elasticomyces elasticus]